MPSNQCDQCGRSQYPGETDTCKRCLMERINELEAANERLMEAVHNARIFARNWQPDEPGPMAYQFGKFAAEMDEAYYPYEGERDDA